MEKAPLTVAPCVEHETTCFVFATNDAYAPYLGVALHSLLAHASPTAYYDICILYTQVSAQHQQKILELQKAHCSIRFIDISPLLQALDDTIFVTHAHFSKEAYYRFFIPQIFSAYEKVVYLDCDMIFLEDIHHLAKSPLHNKPMAAVLEYKFKCKVEFDPILRHYALEILKLRNVQKYFNSGVLIFDIQHLISMNFTQKCLEKLREIQRPRTVDQCVLNSLLQENMTFLDAGWNLQTHVELAELKKHVPLQDYAKYMEGFLAPKVVHYCSPLKPWNTDSIPFADLWWQYAKQSAFLDAIAPRRAGD